MIPSYFDYSIMLKLEKISNSSGSNLIIRLREKDLFFEPCFLKAFFIALLLHLSALLVFHIAPYPLTSTFTFSPVQVESDKGFESVSTFVTHYSNEEEVILPSILPIPDMDWLSPLQESTLISSPPLDIHDFTRIEEKQWPKWEIPLTFRLERPVVQLTMSASLAGYSLKKKDPLLDQMDSFLGKKPFYTSYHVQVDLQNGEIYWYEKIESSGQESIDKITENILLRLQFDTYHAVDPIEGEIHFVTLDSIL